MCFALFMLVIILALLPVRTVSLVLHCNGLPLFCIVLRCFIILLYNVIYALIFNLLATITIEYESERYLNETAAMGCLTG